MAIRPRDEFGFSMGLIVDVGYDEISCPFCGGRECLTPSKNGPLPDGRTIFYCQVNNAPAFRSYLGETEEENENE